MINDKKHIYRDFNASTTRRIRYDDDDFRLKIRAFDKTVEEQFFSTNHSYFKTSNAVSQTINGFPCLMSKNSKNPLTLEFKYIPKIEGTHRLELMYMCAGYYYDEKDTERAEFKHKKVSGAISINGKKPSQVTAWVSHDTVHNKHYAYFTVKANQVDKELSIKYKLSPSMGFIALGVKHFDVWVADRHLDSANDLTMKKATVQLTEGVSVDTLTVELMYTHELDNFQNKSKYVFDYRDEVNLYIEDNNGETRLVFGGYISTVTVDEDLTTMTLTCASRLIDLDHRYSLSEIKLNGGIDEAYNKNYSNMYSYDNWGDTVRAMCDYAELPLDKKIDRNKKLDRNVIKYNYGTKKGRLKKFFGIKNMKSTFNKTNVTLRNGAVTGSEQSVCIYKSEKGVLANVHNGIYLDMGMGEGVTEKTVQGSSGDDPNLAVNMSIHSSVKSQAEALMKQYNKKGMSMLKPVWQFMTSKISYGNPKTGSSKSYTNFVYSASYVLSHQRGNCCDQARLMCDLLSACGVPNNKMRYMNASCGSQGHVYPKFKLDDGTWFIADPVTVSGWGKAWNNCRGGTPYVYPNHF